MRGLVSLFCTVAVALAASSARAQVEAAGDPIQLPAGHRLRAVADLGVSADWLGRGFTRELKPAGPGGEAVRVFAAKTREIPVKRHEITFEQIENSVEFDAHARFLLLNGGIGSQTDRRYMLLQASYTDKIVELQVEGDPAADTDVYAARIYYGWVLYFVIEGDKSSFTAEVAARLQNFGFGVRHKASEYNLKVQTRMIGLEAKREGEVPLPTSVEDIPKLFKTSEPVPIFVEYVTRRPLPAKPLAWETSALQPNRRYRVSVEVEVLPGKADGRPWDVGNGPPDPIVTLLVDGRVFKSCTEKNTLRNTCLSDLVLTLRDTTSLALEVIDKDFSSNDDIGATTPIRPIGAALLREPLELSASGQIKRATVTFSPLR